MQSLQCTPPFLILLQIKHTTHLFLKLSIPVRRGRKIRGAIDHNHPCHTFTPLVPLSPSTATLIIHLHILNHPLSHPTIPYHPSSHPHYIVSHCHTLTIATTLSPSTITPSLLTFTHSPCWFHLLSCPLLTASLVCPLPHLLQTLLHTPPSLPEGKGLQFCHKMLLQVPVIGDTPYCLLNFHFQIPFIFLILQLIYIITAVEIQQTATK